MSNRLSVLIIVLILAGTLALTPQTSATAAGTRSWQCVNSTFAFAPYYSIINYTPEENETMTVVGTGVVSGTASTLTMMVDGVVVDSKPWPGPVSHTFPGGGELTVTFLTEASVYYDFTCSVPIPDSPTAAPTTIQAPASPFSDGRINNWDAAAPVFAYPVAMDGGTGLALYDPAGNQVLVASPQQLAAAPDTSDDKVLIAEAANGVALYRIRGGWLITATQYNGKQYSLTFTDLFSHSYRSSESY